LRAGTVDDGSDCWFHGVMGSRDPTEVPDSDYERIMGLYNTEVEKAHHSKVVDIRNQLKERNVPSGGTKAQLIQRISECRADDACIEMREILKRRRVAFHAVDDDFESLQRKLDDAEIEERAEIARKLAELSLQPEYIAMMRNNQAMNKQVRMAWLPHCISHSCVCTVLQLARCAKNDPAVTELNFMGAWVGDDNLPKFVEALKDNTHMVNLHLPNMNIRPWALANPISQHGCAHLKDLLLLNTTLVEL
jgi:hypothetical protein